MRAVGLDLGTKRIGVALSNTEGTVATPYEVIERSTPERDYEAIAAIVREVEAERIVVGLPLSLDGGEGSAAVSAREEAAAIEAAVGIAVDVHDERLTTVTAERTLVEQRMRREARRRVIDKVAAAVMLQSWLESRP